MEIEIREMWELMQLESVPNFNIKVGSFLKINALPDENGLYTIYCIPMKETIHVGDPVSYDERKLAEDIKILDLPGVHSHEVKRWARNEARGLGNKIMVPYMQLVIKVTGDFKVNIDFK